MKIYFRAQRYKKILTYTNKSLDLEENAHEQRGKNEESNTNINSNIKTSPSKSKFY